MARSSKNLIRAQCFMKGVSRSTPMVTIHTIVKPYGSIVNGSLKYLADSISCTICVFDNCKPLPSQLERVILRAESNIPMLCNIGNIFLGCAPSPAGTAVPAPAAVSAVPALTAVSVPEQILSSSLASLSNNTSLPSDYSDDPDISNVIHLAEVTPVLNVEDYEYLVHSPTPPMIDPILFLHTGPIVPVPLNSPITQSEVYSLRAYELAEANLPVDADPTIPSREISGIQSKLFLDFQKRGLSWDEDYADELFRLGVLVRSPPRKKPKPT